MELAGSSGATNGGSAYNYVYLGFGKTISNNEQDAVNDSPTNYEETDGTVHGNFCILNSLDKGADVNTVSNGNLEATWNSNNGHSIRGTMGVSSGKYYWEATGFEALSAGIIKTNQPIVPSSGSLFPGGDGFGAGNSYGYYASNGSKATNGTVTGYGASFGTSDTVGVALNLDDGEITFYKNNASQGVAFTGISGTFAPAFGYQNSGTNNLKVNFGAAGFKYTPPSGYKALCTQNLDDLFSGDEVNNPSKYFDVKNYSGNGSGDDGKTQSIKGVQFQPDLVWLKARTSSWWNHFFDVIRGAGNTISPNSGNGQATLTSNQFTSFNSDGYTVKQLNNDELNEGGQTYTSAMWDAGTAVNSSVDSCSQTVNAQWNNPTAGFSITSYEGGGGAGQTVAHGLGAKPDMFWIKRYDGSQDWACYHKGIGASPHENMITLNSSNAFDDSSTFLNDTAPTNTLITLGTESRVNTADSAIIYAWTGIPGFSKFGSYTGNGNADGPFIQTSFRPKYIMIKHTSAEAGWAINDAARENSNVSQISILADTNAAEFTSNSFNVDFLSNGFKLRTSNANWNGNGITYIYAAFAEFPQKTARAQ
jgi:hypothetical protein